MISWHLADYSIRKKLFLLFLLLIIGPFLLYVTIVVGQVARQMESMGFRTADLVVRQTAQFVETRVDTVKRALDLLTLDSTVRLLSAQDSGIYETDPGAWIRDAALVRSAEDRVAQNNPDILGFVLYMAGGIGSSTLAQESNLYRPIGDPEVATWVLRRARASAPVLWVPGPGTLTAVREIPDDDNLQATVGWARADVKRPAFEAILDKAQFSPASAAFLVNSRGELVAASSVARRLGDRALARFAESKGAWPEVEDRGLVYRTSVVSISMTDWQLVLAVPNQDIGAFGDQARNLLLLALLGILPFMVPLSLWAASRSTRRLQILITGVREVEQGGFDTVLPVDGGDEFGELTRSFNQMVGKIHLLVEDQYRLGIEVKNQELLALQAQINPHFLYNTLDLINCLALEAGQPRIVETVTVMAKFYRLTLSGGAETLPLSKELEHVSTYVRIQNLRFNNSLTLTVDADPGLLNFQVLKMLLQPLVENSIIHGIRERPDEVGGVTIRVRKDGTSLVFEVEDDGVGMDPGALARLLSPDQTGTDRSDHGYGVYNIDRRLRLRYGAEAGLRFESTLGKGTVAWFRIPLDGSGS